MDKVVKHFADKFTGSADGVSASGRPFYSVTDADRVTFPMYFSGFPYVTLDVVGGKVVGVRRMPSVSPVD